MVGELSQPEVFTRPANMVIQFPTSKLASTLARYLITSTSALADMLGASSLVVVTTDYSASALTCTCQDVGLAGLLYLNRRSCSVLQRSPDLDMDILDSVR